ncbi:phosphate ABC transporter substrate-binding protein [Brevibacillus daliensis]|uniref:phosphate ABC transporter substrate-binding protein n=1 Tax=Brevibacillus daliensis TaxID=2892995 RepID=UPI001E50BB18|nr:phosphate ABC transporter substrate-binding protein [Brevibacillus daliensis]
MKKIASIFIAGVLSLGMMLTGCSNDSGDNADGDLSGLITTVGSTAMQPLIEQASKKFIEENPKVQIQVQGGGSGTGLSQVTTGAATIGNSDIFAEEKKGVPAKELVGHKIAVVGMAPVVNAEVGVTNLTKQQLIDIFTGKITNWKDVGGIDQEVVLVNRPKNSGTRATFVQYALDGNTEADGITEESSGTVRKIISETPGAIGYLGTSYLNDMVQTIKLDGVEPTNENIITNEYPVWAYQHMYTKGEPDPATKAFLDYMMTEDIQIGVIESMKYIPASAMLIDRDADGKVTPKA